MKTLLARPKQTDNTTAVGSFVSFYCQCRTMETSSIDILPAPCNLVVLSHCENF